MVLINKKLKSLLIFTLKLSVSSGLLYLLVGKIGIDAMIQYFRLLNLPIFFSAAGLYIFSIYISSLRWSLLINQKMSIKNLFSMYMIGSFFNTCLPGIIGGDAVKAYYLSRALKKNQSSLEDNKTSQKSPEAYVAAIASIFMDRYIGLSALIIIGMIAFPFGFGYIDKTSHNHFIIWFMPIIFFGFFFTSFFLFRFRIAKKVGFFSGIYDYIDMYKTKKDVIVKGFIYSLIVQLSGIIAVYILSLGMSFNIHILPLLIFMPMIILISMIPISISGIGLREFAFAFFLGSTGVPSDIAVPLSLAWFLSVVAANLLGFIEYFRFKAEFSSMGSNLQP